MFVRFVSCCGKLKIKMKYFSLEPKSIKLKKMDTYCFCLSLEFLKTNDILYEKSFKL